MWHKYPYTDAHELNLDWFLSQFKELVDAWDAQKVDYEKFKVDVTDEFNTLAGKFQTLDETVAAFIEFVNNYFENLDVQQEINNKLDQMASDGSLDTLLDPLVIDKVPSAVTSWLDANVDPVGSAVTVDSTLTIAGSAADSKIVGDNFDTVFGELGINNTFVLPANFLTANYENVSQTRRFKYQNNVLDIMLVNTTTGEVPASELTYAAASLTLNDGLAYILGSDNAYLSLDYDNTYASGANTGITLRYYKNDFSTFKSGLASVPVGTGHLDIDLKALATNNNIDITEYPKVVIRALSIFAHTAAATESATLLIKGFTAGNNLLSAQVEQNTIDIAQLKNQSPFSSTSTIANPFRFDPYYAHLFINTVSDAEADTYVPSQSIYDIEISKRLGFKVIEANTHILTDGTSLVTHGTSDKFGPEFVAASGSTYTDAQVQDTLIASVDMPWVRDNVVYKAKYPKNKTTPPTLEEFLLECRKNEMIPLINYKNIGQFAIADKVMGKDNYIFYGAGNAGRNISNCIIATFSHLLTKQDMLDWIDQIGTPCIVGTTHYNDFTLTEWKDIVDSVHEKGALMAFAYMTESQAQDLLSVGFDCAASAYALNPVDSGNLINKSADLGFTDFTVTGGTQTDAELTMNANGTVKPGTVLPPYYLTGMWLDITFTGDISVSMGRWITHGNAIFNSSEPRTVHLSTYAMNYAPSFEIKALTQGTKIQNIVYKVSQL